jgi:GT2 family glycosyltransferase
MQTTIARAEITALPGWRFAGSGEALEDCSLIVATCQRPNELLRLLNSLLRIPDRPGEVVVVGVNSFPEAGERLLAWVKSQSLPFTVCYAESEAGLTRQRNAGVDLSTRPYLFYLDDDAVPLPGYFREMRRVFLEDRAKRIGALAGCVLNEMNKPIPRRWRLRFALRIVPRIDPMIYYPSGTHTPRGLLKPFSGIRKVDVMPGCAWTFRREVFETERFSSFFKGYSQGEDLEMSLRVGRRWEIYCCGDARILHLPASGGRPVSFARGLMEMRNRHFIWKRHSPHPGAVCAARFWLDTTFLIVMDFLWLAVRPWRIEPLGHAAGTLVGLFHCLVFPPHFEEGPVRREYCLASGQGPDR